jgi:hypothetical protein
MSNNRCESCNKLTPSYDCVNYAISEGLAYRIFCTSCFNAEVTRQHGLQNFENIRLKPIKLADCLGAEHQFHFITRLLGDIVSLEAFELRDDNPAGYRFQQIGNSDDEVFSLLGQLIQKIRKALSVRHIEEGDLGLRIVDSTVRGRIEWDETSGGLLPLIVVDGREISWKAFGKMLTTFEGSQFKLELLDPSAEV